MPIAPVHKLKKDEIVWLGTHKCKHKHCLEGDTLVLMGDYSWKPIRDLREGDYVIGWKHGKGSNFKLVKSRVIATRKTSNNIRLLYGDGQNLLKITTEHRVLVRSKRGSKEQFRYTPASHLKDKVTVRLPVYHRNKDWKLGWLYGFFLSDGNYGARSVVWNNTNIALIKKVKDFLNDLGYSFSIREQEPNGAYGGSKVVFRVAVYSVKLMDIFLAINVIGESSDFKRGFVAGFYDGDGSQNNTEICFYQKRDNVLMTLAEVLDEFGFTFRVHENREIWKMSVPQRLRFWLTFLPFKESKFNFFLNKTVGTYRFNEPIIKDYRLFPGEENDVYDIQTETENFFANGIPVHNSYLEHYSCYLKENPERNRIGFFDIEVSNLNANFGYVLCYAILDDKSGEVIGRIIDPADIRNGTFDRNLIKQLLEDFDQFDTLIGYYSTRFDIPFVRSRAVHHGFKFPVYGAMNHVDIYYIIRNKFKLHRNSLEEATRFLLGDSNKTRIDNKIWMRATAGDAKALAYVYEHCEYDVIDTKRLYDKVIDFKKRSDRSI